MARKMAPAGLLAKVEAAAASLRELSTRLDQIAKKLGEDERDELTFVAQRLRREADVLTVEAASGDIVSTGWALKLCKLGLAASVWAGATYGAAIIDAAGQQGYDGLVGAQQAAGTSIDVVAKEVLGSAESSVRADTTSLATELQGFLHPWENAMGAPTFMSGSGQPVSRMTEQEQLKFIATAIGEMTQWLSDYDSGTLPPDQVYPGDAPDLIRNRLMEAEVKYQRISAMNQLLAEEEGDFSGRGTQAEARSEDSPGTSGMLGRGMLGGGVLGT